jgi:hypothetical protein
MLQISSIFFTKNLFLRVRACCVSMMHIYIFISYASKRSDQNLFVLFFFGSESVRNRTEPNRTEPKPNRTESFRDVERLDYTKTFVSMIKFISYKTMYVITIVNDWEIEQMNVKIAFLYDKIHENVFVVQLTNFEQSVNQICMLNKVVYDLKQFSRV